MKIKPKDLLQGIKDLTPLEQIFIDVSEEVLNAFEFLNMKITSCDNLFMAYLNNTNEKASEMNLQKFIDFYFELNKERQDLVLNTIIQTVGTEIFQFIQNNEYFARLDAGVKKIAIGKKGTL